MITQPSIQAALRDAAGNDVWGLVGSGAPTNGTSGTGVGLAGKGSNYTDYTNGIEYTNTGTKASPTWTAGVTAAGNQVLTNKTLTNPIVTTGTFTTPTITTPLFTDYKVLAATQTFTSNTVAAPIVGFSWTVVPGSYIIEVVVPAIMTTNGGLTISDKLTTAVLTSMQLETYASTAVDNATAVSTQVTATADATKIFDSKTAAYTLVRIQGSLVVGTGGTFALQACQNTSNTDQTSVVLGAYAKLERVL